jgi:RHS repeat-associated protein
MKTKPTLALAAILTSSAFAEMPAKLPEFMNPEQLAKWRAETAAENAAKAKSAPSKPDVQSSNPDVPTPFFTGKPYIESTGTYAFKYRSYNPVLARWTSEDPSGFPDGANGSSYAPTPTCGFDFQGLVKVPFIGSWNGMNLNYATTVNVTSPGEFEYEFSADNKSFAKATGAWTGPLSGQVSCDGSTQGTLKSSIALSNFTNSGIKQDAHGRYFEIYANYTYTYENGGNVNIEVRAATSARFYLE